jgi:hypothetical protein
MHIFTHMHTVIPHWQVELVHSLMLALSLNTDRALEIVRQDKLIEVFAVTAATSPSAYVRSAIFELLTVSTADVSQSACSATRFYFTTMSKDTSTTLFSKLLMLCIYLSS